MVLIETYWNVKYYTDKEAAKTAQVLIETYWNVKERCRFSMHRQTVVLIETYWNVKYTAPDSASTLPLCINRNILECKVRISISVRGISGY